MSLNALNFVDYIVLVVLVASGVLATLRGLTRELMGLAGWGVAAIAARLLQPFMVDLVEDYIKDESLVDIMSWSAPFIGVVLAWFVFANLASPGLKKIALGNLDRLLGFLFGAIRGIVVVALVYAGVLFLTESEENFPTAVIDSASIAPVRIVATIMTGFAPDDFREKIQDAIPEQDLGDIKDGFTDETNEQLDNAQDAAEDIIDDAQDGDLLPDEQIIIIPESN